MSFLDSGDLGKNSDGRFVSISDILSDFLPAVKCKVELA
jgi:hypothetical protein